MPNFVLLDTGRAAHCKPRGSGPTIVVDPGEDWWADVLADPRARKRNWRTDKAVRQDSYRLSDELRPVILVACSKCDWRAAFSRDELIAFHGATCAMPSLLNELTKPGCIRLGNQWGHCGVYYVEPTGGLQQTKRE